MARRGARSGLRDPVNFFETLRPTRRACTDQLRNLTILGAEYRAMLALIGAMDAAADLFTGKPNFYLFSTQPDLIGPGKPDAGA